MYAKLLRPTPAAEGIAVSSATSSCGPGQIDAESSTRNQFKDIAKQVKAKATSGRKLGLVKYTKFLVEAEFIASVDVKWEKNPDMEAVVCNIANFGKFGDYLQHYAMKETGNGGLYTGTSTLQYLGQANSLLFPLRRKQRQLRQ